MWYALQKNTNKQRQKKSPIRTIARDNLTLGKRETGKYYPNILMSSKLTIYVTKMDTNLL